MEKSFFDLAKNHLLNRKHGHEDVIPSALDFGRMISWWGKARLHSKLYVAQRFITHIYVFCVEYRIYMPTHSNLDMLNIVCLYKPRDFICDITCRKKGKKENALGCVPVFKFPNDEPRIRDDFMIRSNNLLSKTRKFFNLENVLL